MRDQALAKLVLQGSQEPPKKQQRMRLELRLHSDSQDGIALHPPCAVVRLPLAKLISHAAREQTCG